MSNKIWYTSEQAKLDNNIFHIDWFHETYITLDDPHDNLCGAWYREQIERSLDDWENNTVIKGGELVIRYRMQRKVEELKELLKGYIGTTGGG